MMLGVFDSGLGGLTVVKAIIDRLPQQEIVYFGDTARVPYGSKSAGTIKRYAKQDCEKLLSVGADKIVIACHSAASVAGDQIRRDYEKRGVPVWDVASAGLDEILSQTKGRVGLIGTRATINTGFHKKSLLRANNKLVVLSQACPLLVPLVEEGYVDQPETMSILKKYLRPLLDKRIDSLILGCTHYPLLCRQIIKVVPNNVQVIDPAISIAKQLQDIDEIKNSPKNDQKTRIKLFFSDNSPTISDMTENIFGSGLPYQIL